MFDDDSDNDVKSVALPYEDRILLSFPTQVSQIGLKVKQMLKLLPEELRSELNRAYSGL